MLERNNNAKNVKELIEAGLNYYNDRKDWLATDHDAITHTRAFLQKNHPTHPIDLFDVMCIFLLEHPVSLQSLEHDAFMVMLNVSTNKTQLSTALRALHDGLKLDSSTFEKIIQHKQPSNTAIKLMQLMHFNEWNQRNVDRVFANQNQKPRYGLFDCSYLAPFNQDIAFISHCP